MEVKFNSTKIKILIGLGNPGREYENTYHNVGALFVKYLKQNSQSLVISHKLLVSDSYMNQSGGFMVKALEKYKVKPEELLIVHDDSDIELGKYKLSYGRGSAGHKGVESVLKALGTKNFWRLRIGIRKQETGNRKKAEQLVLQKISAKDRKTLEVLFPIIEVELQ